MSSFNNVQLDHALREAKKYAAILNHVEKAEVYCWNYISEDELSDQPSRIIALVVTEQSARVNVTRIDVAIHDGRVLHSDTWNPHSAEVIRKWFHEQLQEAH